MVGSGSFACAWDAYDQYERRRVVVKVLHGQWSKDQSRLERFHRGARRMARLSHPHIARVFSWGGYESGFYYFTMEYLGGGDLQRAVLEGRLSGAQAIEAIRQIGYALDHMHEHGIVHRDIKPSNILIDHAGRAKLTDFDLVWAPDTTAGSTSHAFGTFLYAAPEIMTNPAHVDKRSDIYSLGMTALFSLYRKKLPLDVIRNPLLIIAGLDCSKSIRLSISKAIAWDPRDRYQSIIEFCEDLSVLETTAAASLTASHGFVDFWNSRFRLRYVTGGAIVASMILASNVAIQEGSFQKNRPSEISISEISRSSYDHGKFASGARCDKTSSRADVDVEAIAAQFYSISNEQALFTEGAIENILIASPQRTHATALQIDREVAHIKTHTAVGSASLAVKQSICLQVKCLTRKIATLKPKIFHFSGHGSRLGPVLLSDRGEPTAIHQATWFEIGRLLKACQVRCVILNTCLSVEIAQLLTEFVDYSIAMDGLIDDRAAIAFSAGFYRSLARGADVRVSFEAGHEQAVRIQRKAMPRLLAHRQ
jgi:serine/threonine protein kinase